MMIKRILNTNSFIFLNRKYIILRSDQYGSKIYFKNYKKVFYCTNNLQTMLNAQKRTTKSLT